MSDHGYPEITPEQRALYSKQDPTSADLIAMATIEADHAMRSLPPHCLPTAGGLPYNPDHANAAAHRCWGFLQRLTERAAQNEQKPEVIALWRRLASATLRSAQTDDACSRELARAVLDLSNKP